MPELRINDDKSCWKKKTKLEKTLICAGLILGLLVLLFLLLFLFKKTCSSNDEKCKTKPCVRAAAELFEYIDLKVDPCENFYEYTCGAYYKNAVKRDSPSPWTSTNTLLENELKSLVVDPIGKKDTTPHIALKKFYQECMNFTKIDLDDSRTFMNQLDRLGGWPLVNAQWDKTRFNWADWYIRAKQIGLPIIGFFDFKYKFQKVNKTVLRITGPNLNSNHLYSPYIFTRLMKSLTESFGGSVDKVEYDNIYKVIETIYKHRDELDPDDTDESTDDDDDEDEDKILKVSTLQNLQEICPNVPWLRILNGISNNNSMFDDSSQVAYRVANLRSYCNILDNLLKINSQKTIVNYYVWSIIQNMYPFLSRARRIYSDLSREYVSRFSICSAASNERFKYLKETLYIRKRSNPKVRADLSEMIDIMKELFVEHLRKCDWMDDTTKKIGLTKAEQIKKIIGADEALYNEEFDKYLGVDDFSFTSDNIVAMIQQKLIKENRHLFESLGKDPPDNWPALFKMVIDVNAFFSPPANTMVIPAPILTSIFYNYKFPAFMNYGPMASTIGHELMHGFSNFSREFELDNGTKIDWWTSATSDAYEKKVQCVIDEYERTPFLRYKLNGTKTLEENAADYVGADIGYEGYQRYVKKYGKEKELIGIPLTPDQIYWVQTATNFCFRKLDDNEIDYEEPDAHAIPSFRVEAPAKNSIYFAEAFNCPVGSRMNPKQKCQLF